MQWTFGFWLPGISPLSLLQRNPFTHWLLWVFIAALRLSLVVAHGL